MGTCFTNVAAYDLKTGTLLYGMHLEFALENGKLRMDGLEHFCGPNLRLKDGTPIVADSAGYVSFPPGKLVEIFAPRPPAYALEPILPSLSSRQSRHSRHSRHSMHMHFVSTHSLCAPHNSVQSNPVLYQLRCIWGGMLTKVASYLGDKKKND